LRITSKSVEFLKSRDERFLGNIVGVFPRAEHSIETIEQTILMSMHKLTVSGHLATQAAFYQVGIGCAHRS
jgi:hypothetical protein